MRRLILALCSLPLLVTAAAARPTKGNSDSSDSGRGPLGRVSAGINNATRSAPQSSGSSDSDTSRYSDTQEATRCDAYDRGSECAFVETSSSDLTLGQTRPPGPPPKVDLYLGAQIVQDSDVAATAEIGIVEGRFRVGGAVSHYMEDLDGHTLSMTMPSLTLGVRIDDLGPTRVFIEGGVVHARTDGDPMGNSTITGPIVGMRVEHPLSRDWSVLGDAQYMWFTEGDISATAARVGLRRGYVQASFRVLDFDVGPPLMGPELGIGF